MIQLNNISKSYGDKVVIPYSSHKFDQSKTHVLLGSSGCGKTTILRMICGLTTPDQGDVIIGGENIKDIPRTSLATKLGYVVQEGGLFPHFTGRENVLLPGKIQNKDLGKLARKMEELASYMDLDVDLLKKYPSQLSGGQRQRVALIRGLILDPEIILMDEPLSALDPLVRQSLKKELKQIFKKLNKTVVMVTHDLHTASFLADKITLLATGKIEQEGTFEDLRNNPCSEFVQEFIRSQMI